MLLVSDEHVWADRGEGEQRAAEWLPQVLSCMAQQPQAC